MFSNMKVEKYKGDIVISIRKTIKRLLKKYKYSTERMEDAVKTVVEQCEMWTANGGSAAYY